MEKIYTGKSLEELEALAYSELTKLGVSKEDISIEVVEQPIKKLFGKKGDYRIKAVCPDIEGAAQPTVQEVKAEAPAPAPAEAPAPSEPADEQTADAEAKPAGITDENRKKAAVAAAYLEKVLTALGIENFKVNMIEKEDIIVLDITGENLGAVIGRRGETLDALQYLAILASNRHDEPYCRMTVDCNGYRDKREETLRALAKRTANKVLRQGRRITLEPMNPYERRIIRSTVADIEGIYSNSIGEEPYRKVVISCSQRHADSKRAERRGGYNGKRPANRSYKQSSGFSTSFEREYKRSAPTEEQPTEYSKETVEAEKNATLYGKIDI